jgi:uncharacterized membrane protein YphA (DoxX/SURF4 family)
MRIWMLLARIFAGLVFVFSGFVKAIDPDGFAIKLTDYFMAFHMEFFNVIAYPTALFFSSMELMIGLNLIFRLRMKFTAWVLLLFMSYFTILTFILAITNPVTDCGCFGDALKLTNWQTFGKNVILFIPTLIIFINRKKFNNQYTASAEWFLASVNYILPILLSVYCLKHEPILDFRPYETGTYIPDKMIVPEGAPVDQYETTLVYEKKGVKQEFNENNLPWQDTTWKWVETKQKLLKKGYEPPIHDFTITTLSGEDITRNVLNDSNYIFLIVAQKLEKSPLRDLRKMNDIAVKAHGLGIKTYCLTSSATQQIEDFIGQFQPVFTVCTGDETTLKTILRSNVGLLLLKQGTILAKSNARDALGAGKVQKNMTEAVLIRQNALLETLKVILLLLLLIMMYLHFNKIFTK